ncbi:MAG: sensor histidine kinase [Rhodobacteraceae bacterium]|nr:sensor histidine kinase [Paracoccaceae bacterium]
MSGPPAIRRRLWERLGFRLALLLSLALAPVGLVAVIQSTQILKEARARAEAALMGHTLRAAAGEIVVIQKAQGAAAALASAMPELMEDPVRCSAVMRGVLAESAVYSFVGFTRRGGRSDCSSADRELDFSDSPLLAAAEADPRPRLGVNPEAPVSGTSILYAAHPVFGPDGAYAGMVWISIPHRALEGAVARGGPGGGEDGLQISTFDREGQLLTSSAGLEAGAAALPRDRSLKALVGTPPTAFTGLPVSGEAERVFSVVPLIEGELYALGSEPATGSALAALGAAIPPWVLPMLMWVVSLGVAWIATERLVSNPIRRLRNSITSFAGGGRIVGEVDFAGAPLEIREVADAYERMTDTILHDEAELEDMVHQKEVLLREVHHRVKNNLQLIASILNMQIRQARSPEARAMMRTLQDRVMSLATIHRGLYQTSGLADIRADELLPEIVRQVLNLGTGPGRRFEVRTSFDDLRLTPDQAVPLSLLLTELLTNALKYGGAAAGRMPTLEISLCRSGGSAAVLRVANSVAPEGPPAADAAEGTGLGAQLADAFAHQLGGALERSLAEGTFTVTLCFEVTPLDAAEERRSAQPLETAG